MQNNNHFSIRVQRAAEKIKQQIDEQSPLEWINAETFAKKMQVKRAVLQQCFYMNFGKKISEYQQHKKIEVACVLLTVGELTIKEISVHCGYGNQNYFTYVFKKHKNMTPTEWQKKGGNVHDGELKS
jgi:AraC-like DNA-binding protein